MTNLIIAAPLQGWAAPLSEVPDAVFAERMMGDGVAIDPVGAVLFAPFDGDVISLPRTGHALCVRSDAGVELLMHVGLDTVALAGEGFMAHVCEGQRVRVGDRLLSFDIDLLAQRAKSLITPIILTNGERFDIVRRTQDRRIEVGEPLMELRPRDAAAPSATGGGEARLEIVCNFAHGLHARPAATIARTAQRFAADVSIGTEKKRANAKSPVSIMTLGARHGETLVVYAVGVDAEAAAEAVAQAAAMREGAAPMAATSRAQPEAAPRDGVITGVCASPGVAVGVAVKLVSQQVHVKEKGRGAELERAALSRAVKSVKARIEQLASSTDERQRTIMAAHSALVDDPELAAAATHLIDVGKSAGFAWRAAIASHVEALSAGGDEYMAARVSDLRDLELQVLTALGDARDATPLALPEKAIVVAHDLLPSQLAALDPRRLAGLCTAGGGATSHVALMAQSLGVPAIAAAGLRVLETPNGAAVILDAGAGVLRVAPSEAELREAEIRVTAQRSQRAAARQDALNAGHMADGTRVRVFANLGATNEAAPAVELGAEGCGLLRTEFLFMDRASPPSEEEQHAQYQAIAVALGERPLVIRTLDAGADKPLPYLPVAEEANPALGVRGLRASLKHPELLRAQLSAILRVQPTPRILLPMVNDVADLRRVRAIVSEIAPNTSVEIGVMIETPAAAMLADQLAAEADFLSIGTNDLAQYALAMDRGNSNLAALIDPLHPAVLRLIARAAEAARAHKRSISVCGAAASDPIAAPLLVGLGIDTLSAAPSMIPVLKARLRGVSLDACRRAAARALELSDANAVRALAATLETPQ